MKISVIIPVYNAAPFVRKAVESALDQPEVGEVVLIEDGSTDDSLAICKKLDTEYDRVKLFTHPNNANFGSGRTRNIGIKFANNDLIAFLDADDYYLDKRFAVERKIFGEKPEVDGVYGAAGRHYYSEEAREKYSKAGHLELVTMKWRIPPDELFEVLIGMKPHHGFITPDALTVKRKVFAKAGYFPETNLHEDTEFIVRLAYSCCLEPGHLELPVAMIGVHDNNRISSIPKRSTSRVTLYERLIDWSVANDLPTKYQNHFRKLKRLASINRSGPVKATGLLFEALIQDPKFLFQSSFIGGAVDHIFGGRLVKAYNKTKGVLEWARKTG